MTVQFVHGVYSNRPKQPGPAKGNNSYSNDTFLSNVQEGVPCLCIIYKVFVYTISIISILLLLVYYSNIVIIITLTIINNIIIKINNNKQ